MTEKYNPANIPAIIAMIPTAPRHRARCPNVYILSAGLGSVFAIGTVCVSCGMVVGATLSVAEGSVEGNCTDAVTGGSAVIVGAEGAFVTCSARAEFSVVGACSAGTELPLAGVPQNVQKRAFGSMYLPHLEQNIVYLTFRNLLCYRSGKPLVISYIIKEILLCYALDTLGTFGQTVGVELRH